MSRWPHGLLAGAGILTSAAGMAVGAIWSVPLLVSAGLVGCAVVWWSGRLPTLRTGTVLLVALLARAVVFPLPPAVSDDGYRYLWDGYAQLEGRNPYAIRPVDDERLRSIYPGLYSELNSPEYYSVYPPSSQLIFRLSARAFPEHPERGWYGVKLLLGGIEISGLFLLSRLIPPGLLVLYAWHPLAIFEAAGQGHTEAGMVGMLFLAVWGVRRERHAVAGAALAGAGWFKLIPFFFIPFTLRQRPFRVGMAALALGGLLALPYVAPYVIPHVRESLRLYVGYFEWNAAPYLLLKGGLLLLTGSDLGKLVGPMLQGAFLAGLPVIWWLHHRQRWTPEAGWLAVSGWFLVTATTVHPWYLLGVLALLPLVGVETRAKRWHLAGWHALAAGSLGTYLYYTHGALPYALAVALGWGGWTVGIGGAAALTLLPGIMRQRGERKWAWVRSEAGPPGRLLDLGAGEGFVGAAAAADGFSVDLADVVDFHRVALPFTLVDGRSLPYQDDAFDVTVLAFVLHHAEDPQALLAEARRVTRGRVIVLESVVETPWDRWWLPLADRLANRLRSGGAMDEQTTFRSAEAWSESFVEAGFRPVREAGRGGAFHRQRMFVLSP